MCGRVWGGGNKTRECEADLGVAEVTKNMTPRYESVNKSDCPGPSLVGPEIRWAHKNKTTVFKFNHLLQVEEKN